MAQPRTKRDGVKYWRAADAIAGIPPVFNGRQKWNYAANASFCIGVMPPSAIFGRSWL